jgi:hypothetical protein
MQSSRFLPGSVLVQVQPEAPFALAARRSCSGPVIRRCRFDSDRGLDVMRVPRVRSRQATHLVMRSVSYAERAGFDPLACYDTASRSPGGDRSPTHCVRRVRFPGSLRFRSVSTTGKCTRPISERRRFNSFTEHVTPSWLPRIGTLAWYARGLGSTPSDGSDQVSSNGRTLAFGSSN